MKKISIYIAKEQLYPLLTGFIFFTFILILNRIFILVDLFINKNVEITLVLKLLLIMLPITMSLTVPMSVLISSIMALGRLSADSEIIALRASGISIFRIIKPIIVTGFFVFILMAIFNETVLVYCNKNYNKVFIAILKSSPAAMLEDGIFTSLGDKTIWVEKINKKSGRLNNIMLYSKNESQGWDVIKAEYGLWQQNDDGSKALNFFNGKLFSSELDSNSFSIVDFSEGNAEILLSESKIDYDVKKKINPTEMNSLELYKMLKSINKSYKDERDVALFWIEFFKKLSIPFSCFVFVIIGAPVGISYRRSARGMGFGISLIIFFIYYIFSMFGQSLSIKGIIHPFIGVWCSNIILLIAGIILIIVKEKA